jgi:aspartyl-tRNA(Asn)/glutamyl-tRNA(Gln) amidotransferase subunit C
MSQNPVFALSKWKKNLRKVNAAALFHYTLTLTAPPALCHNICMELQDLQETADLAHLNMEQGELRSAFSTFDEMLSFFAAMQSADKDHAAFTASIAGLAKGALSPEWAEVSSGMAASARLVNAAFFRPDAPGTGCAKTESEHLLDKAGERDSRFIVIPNVL